VRPILLPVAILLAGLSITWVAGNHDRQASQYELRSQLKFELGDAVTRIEQRMAAYEQLLRGAQALFIATGTMDCGRFRDYVTTVSSDKNLSAIEAIGIVQWVPAGAKTAHVAEMREIAGCSYAIPPGQRESYAPIVQRVPPADSYHPVLGFDAWSTPSRRLALEKSRDSGLAAVSDKIQLSIDAGSKTQPGFVIYLPVYAHGARLDTVAQRRANLLGWVYASFRVHDMIASLYRQLPSGLSLMVHDGNDLSAAAALYRSSNADESPEGFSLEESMAVGGHEWTLSLVALNGFTDRFKHNSEALILVTGTGLSVLLALLVSMMVTGRSRAMQLASSMTKELRESEGKFRAIADCTVNLEIWWGSDGKPRWINPAVKEYTGYTVEECMAMPDFASTLIHPEDMPRVAPELLKGRQGLRGDDIEFRCIRKEGEVIWLSMSWMPIYDSEGMFSGFRTSGRDITERKLAAERIKELAFFDALTCLPNRRLLWDRLEQAIVFSAHSETYGALLFIDLDNFKTLNDTQGHDKGDQLLQQVAQRLSACVREGDTVARMGGDEFILVLGRLSCDRDEATSQIEAVAERILAVLGEPYQLESADHRSTASIGATLFCGYQVTIEELLKQADLAMYRSKERGRDRMCLFDPAMQAVVVARAEMEAALHRAIDEEQFLVHYQAQVSAGDHITGAEALVRWQHPERGIVPPAEFITLAEESGLILALGYKVLEDACTRLAQWSHKPELAHLTIAVNVSAHQFRQSSFVNEILAIVDRTGANPSRLKLELTESVVVDNVEDVIAKMAALKAEGVLFSLDDFGIGYSSLSYLKQFPLDELKIDRSFVRDILVDANDAVIAKTIVALAQSLGLGVIAEGVENEAQRDFLDHAGCRSWQGYYFCRPLPVAEFEALALNWAGDTRTVVEKQATKEGKIHTGRLMASSVTARDDHRLDAIPPVVAKAMMDHCSIKVAQS
jgi:diguanylate cyclase (GGDEF)-like protein/PAS domain S-box-containing protein